MVKIEKPESCRGCPVSDHNHISGRYAVMTDSIITKICSKCQIEKPVSEFGKKKDGLQSLCKICDKKRAAEYRKANPEKVKASKKRYSMANLDKISLKNKIYYEEHYEAFKKYRKSYYQNNRDNFLENAKKYANENPEKIAKRMREYRQTENGKIAEAKGRNKYRKTEKGKITRLKDAQRRRAAKYNANIEDFSHIEIFERDNYICQICKCKTNLKYKNRFHPKRSELDHIVPLSRGGDHSPKNVQCLCHKCNASKNNHEDFGDQLRLF
jgi:5-methylcytosine-specific restriction endonuclease McrA